MGRVALKIAHSAEARVRLLHEARLLERITIPGVVRFRQVAADGSWLALEPIPGQAAHLWAADRSLSEIVDLLIGLCEILGTLHDQGILHGDLKPTNVLVEPSQQPRLIDFGVVGPTPTRATGFHGTLGYAAPEQLSGEPPTLSTDLYNLGALAYRLVTGRTPFVGADPAALAYLPLHNLPLPPSALRPQLPAGLERILLSLLAADPAQRPPSAQVVAQRLRTCLQGTLARSVFGHHAARAALRRQVVRVTRGQPGLMLVHGPKGSGRGCLIDEALDIASQAGLTILSLASSSVSRERAQLLLERILGGEAVALTLDIHDPRTLALCRIVHAQQSPTLLLLAALRPTASLLALGVEPVPVGQLTVLDVELFLQQLDIDPARAQELHLRARGLSGRLYSLLCAPLDLDDLDPLAQQLLVLVENGPAPVWQLATSLGLSEHSLLDVADPLLDCNLLTESSDGATLGPGQRRITRPSLAAGSPVEPRD